MLERRQLRLDDGDLTTLHVARFDRADFELRVVALQPCSTVRRVVRAQRRRARDRRRLLHAARRPGARRPLDRRPRRCPTEPFDSPWHERRACVHVADGEVRLAPRRELGEVPRGDLLQAGPMLVAGGAR